MPLNSWKVVKLMVKYSCGFLFDTQLKNVVLIEKQRPLWQRGFWNGVGGHIEDGETAKEAMSREFFEEKSLLVVDWKQFNILRGNDFEVNFFYSIIEHKNFDNIKTMTDEMVSFFPIEIFNFSEFQCLPNLRWLIPMALYFINQDIMENYDTYNFK